MTVTGKTIAQNLVEVKGLAEGQKIIYPVEKPIKQSGHIRIMRGNFCPDGAVAKITGKEGLIFKGPARCYDSEEDMTRARAEAQRSAPTSKNQPAKTTHPYKGLSASARPIPRMEMVMRWLAP